MSTIIIFAFLSIASLAVMLFMVKLHVADIGSLPSYYLDGAEPAWRDIYGVIKKLLHKLRMDNAHRVEFVVIVLGKASVNFFVKLEDVVLKFLNFIWGKCKIEKNNPSHYWQMMIRHKKDLNENSNMVGNTERSMKNAKDEESTDGDIEE